MRISDWSAEVCSADLRAPTARGERIGSHRRHKRMDRLKSAVRGTLDLRLRVTSWFEAMPRSRQNAIVWSVALTLMIVVSAINPEPAYAQNLESFASKVRALLSSTLLRTLAVIRSEEHTSELQSLMRISYAVFCL